MRVVEAVETVGTVGTVERTGGRMAEEMVGRMARATEGAQEAIQQPWVNVRLFTSRISLYFNRFPGTTGVTMFRTVEESGEKLAPLTNGAMGVVGAVGGANPKGSRVACRGDHRSHGCRSRF